MDWTRLDGRTTRDNETATKGKYLAPGKPVTIVCAVRKDGLTVTVDGKKATSFKGDYNRLTNADVLPMPNRRVVWVGANEGKFVITKLALTPLSGPGKVVR